MPKKKKTKKNHIRGVVRRLKHNDDKIVIEILENFQFVLKMYPMESYDIKFALNRVTFQLQHYALSFLKDEQLFDILIENELYHQAPTSDVPQLNHYLL